MTRKCAAKKSADNHNCSTKDVRTISANQLSETAIKKIPNDSHIQGMNQTGSFLNSTRITIAGISEYIFLLVQRKYSTIYGNEILQLTDQQQEN
jgi:hypothetical protein